MKLDESNPAFTFDFVDAPYSSSPAPDIPLFYDPPYYAFYDGSDTKSIRASHDWLKAKLDCDGPYDGALGFSQGCAVVSSYLLYHQRHHPELPLPLKFAMFICGGIPLQVLEDLDVSVSEQAKQVDQRTKNQLFEKTSGGITADRWQHSEHAAEVSIAINDSRNVFGLDLSKMGEELKIKIPTVHVFGENDPRCPASIQLAHLCHPYARKLYNHKGGHEIPRNKEVSEELAKLLQWCANRATFPGKEALGI